MTVEIRHGDALEVLATLEPDSFHAAVTDPPYGLNFMGCSWDAPENVAFRLETWAAVYRVLKPGAHLLAFGGTRTFHRLVCAIEDAGFEIRDCIMWLYAAGFPKSHDVSKAIDKRGGADIGWFGPWLRQERERLGIAQKVLAQHFPSKTGGLTGCVANWELGLNLPTPEQFNKLCEILGLSFERIEEAEREVVGYNGRSKGWFSEGAGHDITAPATEAACQWQGWGTALKPSVEMVCVARRPLSEGTVAANVLRHGTGALNIDASRVGLPEDKRAAGTKTYAAGKLAGGMNGDGVLQDAPHDGLGRWPANVVHDGSPEVLDAFAKFGERVSGEARESTGNRARQMDFHMTDGNGGYGDTGSAARFFFCGKASQDERLDSKHPTVKPVSLMEWLVRLVTPPGGRVIDPFCGTGSTLVAADRLGFDAVGIEQDAQTIADAHEKIKRMRARRMIGDAEKRAPAAGQLELRLFSRAEIDECG